MKIIIKTLNGSNLEIEVQTTETVLNIKQKIEQLKQFEIDQQKILRKGTILQNEQTVGELGLQEKDLLVVMVNVKKEPPKQQSVQQQFQQQSQQTQSNQEQKPMQVPKPIINSEYLQRNSQYHILLESLVQKGFSKSQCTTKENKAGFSYIYYNQFYYSKYKDVPFIKNLTEQYIKDPEAILQILNEFKKENPQLLQILQQVAKEQKEEIETEITQEQNSEYTKEEKQQLNSLIMMGFSKKDALEGYLACDKNIMIASSYLCEKVAKGELQNHLMKIDLNNFQNNYENCNDDDNDDKYF